MENTVGIFVARFQIHVLHEAHQNLIEEVLKKHQHVIIFLGSNSFGFSLNNPLDFETRKLMVLEFVNARKAPEQIVHIIEIKNMRDDVSWSKTLDRKIKEIYPDKNLFLYGSRDSFLKYYLGDIPKTNHIELVPIEILSATEIRNMLRDDIRSSADYRAGLIRGSQSTYPYTRIPKLKKVNMTVDGLIYDNDKILLAKKPGEEFYRLPGGFVDYQDKNLEEAIKREIFEETNIEVFSTQYIGTFTIPDWRMRWEQEKIMTALFQCKYNPKSIPMAKDDISEIKWFSFEDLYQDRIPIMDEHKEMITAIKIFNDHTRN